MASSMLTVSDSGEIVLISSDNCRFFIPSTAAALSAVITKKLASKLGNEVRLEKYDGKALETVAVFLRGHGLAGDDEGKKRMFNSQFLPGEPEMRVLFDALMAGNDLEIPRMVDVIALRIADRIKDKPVEWVRRVFEIKSDLPAAKVEEIKAEHPWAFEGVDQD